MNNDSRMNNPIRYSINDYIYAEAEVLRSHRYGNLAEQIKATEHKQKVLQAMADQRKEDEENRK